MGWKEYKEKLGIKHNFAKFGCKDFWVKLRRIDSYAYGETKKTDSMTPEELEKAVEEAKKDKRKAEELRRRNERDLVGCIMEWNITDPTIQDDPDASREEKEAPMPLPTVDDVTSLEKLPLEFIVAMMEWLEADSEIAKKISKATGTSSGQR